LSGPFGPAVSSVVDGGWTSGPTMSTPMAGSTVGRSSW
jgi:hypothetical protein